MNIQKEIANLITEIFKDAQVKKVDVDNFLDIHLPGIHSAKGSHLYFNTAKDTIKLGFYCRDVEFIEEVMAKSSSIEKVSNGIRPLSNPVFTNPKDAVEAAKSFISNIQGSGIITKIKTGDEDVPNSIEDDGNEDDEMGFPMISIPGEKFLDIPKDQLSAYVHKWQAPSYMFNWRGGISGCFAEWVSYFNDTDFAPILNESQVESIANNLREHKAIPILLNAPAEVIMELKHVWWAVPLCFWNEIASPILINKNGIFSLYTENFPEDIGLTAIAGWDDIKEVSFERMGSGSSGFDDEGNVNCLTLEYENGGSLDFFELVRRDQNQGSYLEIIEVIWGNRYKTIQQSKGLPMWKEGAGGEGYIKVEEIIQLINPDTYEDISRPEGF